MNHHDNKDLPVQLQKWLAIEPNQDQVRAIKLATRLSQPDSERCRMCDKPLETAPPGPTEWTEATVFMEESRSFFEDVITFEPCEDCEGALRLGAIVLRQRANVGLPIEYIGGGLKRWLSEKPGRVSGPLREAHFHDGRGGRVGLQLQHGGRTVYTEAASVERVIQVALERWVDPDSYAVRQGRHEHFEVPGVEGGSITFTSRDACATQLLLVEMAR